MTRELELVSKMRKVLVLAFILLPSLAFGQNLVNGKLPQLPDELGPNGGLKVECIAGTCTSGGAGADVNIVSVGGNAVTTSVPISVLSPINVVCTSGCSGGPSDTDDNSIVSGSSLPVSILLNYRYNGTTWQRWDGSVTQSGTWNIGTVTTITGITNPVAVTGTFWQATQPVSGTFWQGTQPVSGPLTDTQLRAAAVPVSGAFFQATQPVSIATMPSTPVTGTFWQGTQPVSIAADVAIDRSATSSLANVAASVTSVTCRASAAGRRKVILFNDSTSKVYVKYGATASSTSLTYSLEAGQTSTETEYTGIIDCIWVSAVGNMRVTEITN